MRGTLAAAIAVGVLSFTGVAQAANGGGGAILFKTSRSYDFLADDGAYVVNADGTGLKRLGRDLFDAVWSPDGRQLAFENDAGLQVLGRDGGVRVVATDKPIYGASAWSPDSRRLAYVPKGGRQLGPTVVIVDLSSGRRSVVPPYASILGAASLTWSPDGRNLAFVDDTHGLWVIQPGGNHRRRLLTTQVSRSYGWAPNGKQLVVSTDDGVVVVNADGTGRRLIVAAKDAHPEWSPRGDEIAFAGTVGKQAGLYVVRPNGRALHLLLSDIQFPWALSWSPGGRTIAVTSEHDISAVDIATGAVQPVTRAAGLSWDSRVVAWNPGGLKTDALPGTAAVLGPAPLTQVTGADLVATTLPVTELIANGSRVAILAPGPSASACTVVWDAPSGTLVEAPIGFCARPTYCCSLGAGGFAGAAFGGGSVAWVTVEHFAGLDIFRLRRSGIGGGQIAPVGGVPCPGALPGDCLQPELDLVGGGDLIVFDSWMPACEHPSYPMPCATSPKRDGTLWRVDGSTAVLLASSAGGLTPLGIDAGRILVDDGDGTLQLLARDGARLGSFDVGVHAGARLEGDDLVVQRSASLDVYSASTGSLRATWSLPTGAHLDGVQSGLVAYDTGAEVHVVRLADGRDVRLDVAGHGPMHAAMGGTGLFYSYGVDDHDHPGRVAFVPLSEFG